MSDDIIHYSLKDWFAESFENQKNDPVKHILVLTYEFDDQQLINLVCCKNLDEEFQLRISQIKTIASLRPIVIYDSRKTKEFNSLPHFIELYPVHKNGFACHHSKAYLIISEKQIKLSIGSCNLTHSGLFKNREVWNNFTWNNTKIDNFNILESFLNILEEHYCTVLGNEFTDSITEILNTISEMKKIWTIEKGNNEYTLLSSGYKHKSSGLKLLKELWGENKIKKLFIVSPFFDQGGNKFLIDDFISHFGEIEECEIISDQENKKFLSKEHFGNVKIKSYKEISSLLSDNELSRIKKANDNQSIKDLIIKRKLHAKIIILMDQKGKGLLYYGSANFSTKAWNGANQELGLVSRITNTEKYIESLFKELNVQKENRYNLLPDKIQFSDLEDDENPIEKDNFPDFINKIILECQTNSSNEKQVYFELFGENLSLIDDYEVYWGKIKILFKNNLSQSIPLKDFFTQANLIGNRNLKFILKIDPVKYYYFAYIYSKNIQIEKENIVYTSSNDWLEYYLGEQNSKSSQNEWLPGETSLQFAINNDLSVVRDENIVIKMQHYLDDFSKVEQNFIHKVENINGNSILSMKEKEKRLEEQIENPLLLLGNILFREKKSDADISFLFKIGELILFIQRININKKKKQNLIKKLIALVSFDSYSQEVYKQYINLIMIESDDYENI